MKRTKDSLITIIVLGVVMASFPADVASILDFLSISNQKPERLGELEKLEELEKVV